VLLVGEFVFFVVCSACCAGGRRVLHGIHVAFCAVAAPPLPLAFPAAPSSFHLTIETEISLGVCVCLSLALAGSWLGASIPYSVRAP